MGIMDTALSGQGIQSMGDLLLQKYGIYAVPTYNAMRCSERKSCGNDCAVCYAVCPVGIYPEGKRKKPVWTQCVKCGICAASCPDRCITPPAARAEQYLMAVNKKGETVICCAEDNMGLGLTVSCIAAVSWEQMAYAALGEGLVISLKACEKCNKTNFKQRILEQIQKLRFFLGDEAFEKKVRILQGNDTYIPEDTGMSRRELFRVFREMPLDRAIQSLPNLENRLDNGLLYRALLRDRVAETAQQAEPSQRPKYRVMLPVFTDKCYNCGTCQRLCPQNALNIITSGDKILATVEVWRCVGCGICANACKTEGISGLSAMRVSTLGKVALKRIQGYPCADCGKLRLQDAEEGVCPSCLSKRKMIRLRDAHLHTSKKETN